MEVNNGKTKKRNYTKDVPDVDEVGATSAPLLSASYYIGINVNHLMRTFYYVKKNTMEVL